MIKAITFSGWGQAADALAPVIPVGATAQHIHYQHFEGARELLPFLGKRQCDVLIGWSLGGQLAIRSIHYGHITTKLLVLLATPYDFIDATGNPFGMETENFNLFEQDFYKSPEKTLRRFNALVSKGDSHATTIAKTLRNQSCSTDGWLKWLRELRYFSGDEIKFTNFPKTLVIHGRNDHVVRCDQTEIFYSKIPHCNVTILEDAGHALHLHNTQLIQQLISNELTHTTTSPRRYAEV